MSLTINLVRFAYGPSATLGRLKYNINGEDTCLFTVERPWLDNRPNVSCIPEGFYKCLRYSSDRFPDTFQVMNVIDRTYILFHVGNQSTDVQGCIAIGTHHKHWGVVDSMVGMDEFRDDLKNVRSFNLKINHFHP